MQIFFDISFLDKMTKNNLYQSMMYNFAEEKPYEAMSEAAVQQLAALDSGAELPESGRVITLDYEFKLRNSTSPPVTG